MGCVFNVDHPSQPIMLSVFLGGAPHTNRFDALQCLSHALGGAGACRAFWDASWHDREIQEKENKKQHEKDVCARCPILCQKIRKRHSWICCRPSSGHWSFPAVPLWNQRVRPRGDVSGLVNISGGGQPLTPHCYGSQASSSVPVRVQITAWPVAAWAAHRVRDSWVTRAAAGADLRATDHSGSRQRRLGVQRGAALASLPPTPLPSLRMPQPRLPESQRLGVPPSCFQPRNDAQKGWRIELNGGRARIPGAYQ